jgi:hypothetical protein
MKQMAVGCVVVAFLAGVACERHSWEETKVLHEQHGGHGAAHGAQGGQDAAKEPGPANEQAPH